ncbi:outer membrane beta-barrel protein [Chitinophaga skermanii]|uniref:Outer membrane beta-barrel protein n=1 Tax=Chitinophaga skermanii TaxID=331697 RepID=A0A327QPG8_9BACT|nr:TonB-dependent receptor [Chitinophaga skermanii]RAJ06526.1 outer membrane beta-barrel protein [Chitinophaga skermanii]
MLQVAALYAQMVIMPSTAMSYRTNEPTKPLPYRNVYGIVRDSAGKAMPMAAIRLLSTKDTVAGVTNEYGTFVFKNIRSAEFTIQVRVMSYAEINQKYFFNDTKKDLVLQPLKLRSNALQLQGITVTTPTGPSQRGDTTEFWAKDYIVRDFARLEDLLKKVEGVTIDKDGTLFYNGEQVVRAMFNGKQYFNGSVKDAMKELPADIIERIQIIEDNKDGTGPRQTKTEESSKTLNIVTKADKSAGKMYAFAGEAGTTDRFGISGSRKTIDGPKQTGISLYGKQAPVGIRQGEPVGTISKSIMPDAIGFGGAGIGSNGMSTLYGAGLSLGHALNTTTTLNHSYSGRYNNSSGGVESITEQFYDAGNLLKKISSRNTTVSSNHELATHLSSRLNKGFMTFRIGAAYRESENASESTTEQTGIFENVQKTKNANTSKAPSITLNGMSNIAMSNKASFNIGTSVSFMNNKTTGEERNETFALHSDTPDSSLVMKQNSLNRSFNAGLTMAFIYSMSNSLKIRTSIESRFESQREQVLREQLKEGAPTKDLNDLSYDNTSSIARLPATIALEYNPVKGLFFEPKVTYSFNAQSGNFKLSHQEVSRTNHNILPELGIRYDNMNYGSVSINVGQVVAMPAIAQINPNAIYHTPFDITYGNPDIKNSITNRYMIRYNVFLTPIKTAFAFNVGYNTVQDAIVSNRILKLDDVTKTMTNETYYLNIDGNRTTNAMLNLSKNLKKLNVTIKYDASFMNNRYVSFNNGTQLINLSKTRRHGLTMELSPLKWLDLSPAFAYNNTSSKNNSVNGLQPYNRDFSAYLAAKIFLPANFSMEMNAKQNIMRGTNLLTNTSPFVMNANIEKRIFKKKDGIISFVVMDAFQQNIATGMVNFDNGYTNTRTNGNSRYFLLQFSWQPQTWGKSSFMTGQRRGDGSFK